MKTKHTPGPWTVDKYGSLLGLDNKVITVWGLGIAHGDRTEETESNACLFQASADLLAALRQAVACIDEQIPAYMNLFGGKTEPTWVKRMRETSDAAHAAIAKAEGRG